MSKVIPHSILALLCVLIFCCKKETSLEGHLPPDPIDTSGQDTTDIPDDTLNLDTTATFSMHTSTDGSCTNFLVQGNYVSGATLDESHTVTLEVQVDYPGQWEVTTETVNGVFFANGGIFTEKGLQTITLYATGVPGETGYTIVPVVVGNSACGFAVNITDP
ncbi:hypothetical protein [uncultured Chitinophaga sp.]|jgi:hypothetical protein|uniref:hypothetical protein n=1 Tax=uncultured Chitinophaga sp. TaxID=339340 RepID=UPI002638C1E3|nr:hypothetical protein [uncultured Chitinophaga sp.]